MRGKSLYILKTRIFPKVPGVESDQLINDARKMIYICFIMMQTILTKLLPRARMLMI